MSLLAFPTEVEELRERIALNAFADEVLEECIRDRLSLKASLDRFLAKVTGRMGACGGAVLTRDEALNKAAFGFGDLGGEDPWTLLTGRADGLHRVAGKVLLCQRLDVAGTEVGQVGFLFDEILCTEEAARERLDCVAEELDAVLTTIHTAAEKQTLIEQINLALSNRVFEAGLDEAVAVLHRCVGFQKLVFVWRDSVNADHLFYRMYRDGELEFHNERPHPGMETAIKEQGLDLLSPERHRLRVVLGIDGAVENVLVSGAKRADWLGKVLVLAGPDGFSTFALDLVRLLAEMARERLVDHNRERRHLAQFFPGPVINALLRETHYQEKFLAPREEKIAILYADINGFTKLSEQVLEQPSVIGRFVDDWSAGAVDILWRHGGTFDKMVGDCIIGLFGPPFYQEAPEQRALAAARAAREILDFTIAYGEKHLAEKLSKHPDFARGLGLAIGINLCPACVGTMGPNQDLTAFSSGMNTTARLQSLAGFREILAMDSVVEALRGMPEAQAFAFSEMDEAKVKNVSKPIRFARVG
ncbi:MAG: adenylate/guanylate cyclase domain-containing protein [Deltaproteobacteria bacterium]|nr:adenylate/guanylate cyclase domain-containing protein [Deltaproteobacteria bacterium]